MERLYAIGETSCNGVHGANRLASNSILESLVFARQAARDIVSGQDLIPDKEAETGLFEPDNYKNMDKMRRENRELVRQEIERRKKEYEQQHNHEIKCG